MRGSANFFNRRHGFNPCNIGPALFETEHLVDEDFNRVFFRQRAKRREKITCRTNGTGDNNRTTSFVSHRARMGSGKLVNLARAVLHIMQHQATTIAAEAVCENDIRPGIDKALMQRLDAVGLINVPDLRRFPRDKTHFEKIGPRCAVGDEGFTRSKERGE